MTNGSFGRLVVTHYFLNEDNFGKIHLGDDRKVHVPKVYKDELMHDTRFKARHEYRRVHRAARPHGIAMK